jgi:hypothetical protein
MDRIHCITSAELASAESSQFWDRVMSEPVSLHEVSRRPWTGQLSSDECNELDLCGFAGKVAYSLLQSQIFGSSGVPINKAMLSRLPHSPAVYVLNAPLDSSFDTWRIVYIGKAVDLHQRWNNTKHHRQDEAVAWNCRLDFIEVERGCEGLIEAALIYHLKPAWNERQ